MEGIKISLLKKHQRLRSNLTTKKGAPGGKKNLRYNAIEVEELRRTIKDKL